VTTDHAFPAALCPSRERLVRIATMIRDAERAAPAARAPKRRARDAALLALPVRRRPARRTHDDAVPLAS
jgi:hypothetical protein